MRSGKRPQHPQGPTDPPLDPRARDVIGRSVRLVHRCGASPGAIKQAAIEELDLLPRDRSNRRRSVVPYLPLAPELMTRWHKDPAYVDETGRPQALPLWGRKRSFASLSRAIDPTGDVEEYLRYLIRSGSVRYQAGHYRAVRREVMLRHVEGPRDMRNLDGVDAMLRTAEHNLMPADQEPGWFERTAHNARVPARLLPAFAIFLEQHSMSFLKDVDAWLHDASSGAQEGERVQEIIVGVYHSQTQPTRRQRPSVRKRRSDTQRRARRAS